MAAPIRVDIPVPFPMGSVNAWLFPGSEPALVDCGIGTKESYQLVRQAVKEHVADPTRLRLYITHGHVDHAGNAFWLREEFGTPLHAPSVESPYVETFRRDSEERNDAFADAMRDHGMPDEEVRALRARSHEIDDYLEDVPIAGDAPDGGKAVFGETEVTLVRTPGHTAGSTSFVTEDNQILTGDTLLEQITSNALELLDRDHGAHHQYVETIESMRRYVGMEALPGHLDPYPLTDAVLDRHLDRHHDRSKNILDLLHRPRTAYSLMDDIFPDLRFSQKFLAMSELVGHLHSLEIDGKAKGKQVDGLWRYQAA